MADPFTIGSIAVGGITSLVGSFLAGDISEKQFNRQMDLQERQLEQNIRTAAAQMGLSRRTLRQQWQQFMTSIKEQRRQFDKSHGLQREQFEFTKFREILNPIRERNRRSKNLISAFSRIAGSKTPQAKPAPTPVNPIATPAPAPTNPITGVA